MIASTKHLTFARLSYFLLTFIFFPIRLFGLLYTQVKALILCLYLDVSYTATHPLSLRWLWYQLCIYSDNTQHDLVEKLPLLSPFGLHCVFLSDIVWNRFFTHSEHILVQRWQSHYLYQRQQAFDSIYYDYAPTVDQLVVLGSGFNTRGFEPHQNRRCFDCDTASVLALKQKYLSQEVSSHVSFVAIDLYDDQWLTTLSQHGYCAHQKTLFILEGLSPYIPQSHFISMIHQITRYCQNTCMIALDYYQPNFFNHYALLLPILSRVQEPLYSYSDQFIHQLHDLDIIQHTTLLSNQNVCGSVIAMTYSY